MATLSHTLDKSKAVKSQPHYDALLETHLLETSLHDQLKNLATVTTMRNIQQRPAISQTYSITESTLIKVETM